MKFWEMPCSRSNNVSYISYSSNIGFVGVWIFRIDQENIVPACPKSKHAPAVVCARVAYLLLFMNYMVSSVL